MWVDLIQVLLQQGLLGKNGILDDQLEQAGDVVRVQMVSFAQGHQALQQVTLAVDIAYRAMRRQLGLADFDSQPAALCQQREQLLIQGAYLIAQGQ